MFWVITRVRSILKSPDRAPQVSLLAITSALDGGPHQISTRRTAAVAQVTWMGMGRHRPDHHALRSVHTAEADRFSRLLCSYSCIRPSLFPHSLAHQPLKCQNSCRLLAPPTNTNHSNLIWLFLDFLPCCVWV